jgi:hypothetical protein
MRFLLPQPLALNAGQRLVGTLDWRANEHRSYDLVLSLSIEGTSVCVAQTYTLHAQQYAYLFDARPAATNRLGEGCYSTRVLFDTGAVRHGAIQH